MRLWPVVYEGENDGYLIRHVCPIVKERNSVSSQGSQNDFFPHVDNPDLKIAGEPDTHELAPSPDTLTLFSLRNSENVYTSLIRLDDVLEKLSDKSLDLLQKPLFTVRRPDSFNQSRLSSNQPLISKHLDHWYSRFDWHNVSATTDESSEVLEELRRISLDPKLWLKVFLEPGQAISFLNQRTMHTRNAFTPKFDGSDRWLLRIFGLFEKPAPTKFQNFELCQHNLRTA